MPANVSAEHTSPSRSRQIPVFFWVMLAAAVIVVPLLAVVSVRSVRDGDSLRDDGWQAARDGGAWRVASVTPGSQAAALETGDEIVAVDGDVRAGRIGPGWQLTGLMPGDAYRLTIRRGEVTTTVSLQARARPDPAFTKWVVAYLAVALTCFIVAMMVALVKPEDRMVQFAALSQLLLVPFILAIALRPVIGIRQDRLAIALELTFPFYFVCGYLFFERFPHVVTRTRFWRWIGGLVVIGGGVVWLIRSVNIGVRLLPLEARLTIVDRYEAQLAGLFTTSRLLDMVFVMTAFVAMAAVAFRNYRVLPAGSSDRRRVRIIVAGQSLSLVSAVAAATLTAIAESVGIGTPFSAEDARKTANALAIAGPLSFGYAITRQRVLGFRMTVRLGIQYLLAQNALRTAVLVPLAWLTYTVVTRPEQTVGDLLFTGYARLNLVVMILAGIGLQYRTELGEAIDRRFFRSAYDTDRILRRLIDAVKLADSAAEIAETASREIDAALHVTRVLAWYRDAAAGAFTIGYSSHVVASPSTMADESPLVRAIGTIGGARTVDELRAHITAQEVEWLDQLGIELVVPMSGIDQDVVGLLMVGGKKSEEPFTSADRRLLQQVAFQIGAVYEVLSLREQVGRQQDVQSEVLASIDDRHINLVKECPACGRCYDRTAERCVDDDRVLILSMPVERVLGGKYRLDRLLGRGGMGAVYEALDQRLNRRVALKVIKGSAFHNTSARRRFAREAQACARLTHPAIVRVYDYGAFDTSASYLVMELVHGRTWRAELDRLGAFTPEAAADLLDQVMAGMESAHDAGVLHRDLKPDNLLIAAAAREPRPQVKILDFGLAKVRESSFADPKSQTLAGVAMGTLGYMSPEQLAATDVDARTDVYAIGVVALETLTGHLPKFGPGFHALIEAEVDRRLTAPARTDAHQALAAAIARALAPDRDRRYASIPEMRAVLIPAIRQCGGRLFDIDAGMPTGGNSTPVPPASGVDSTQTSGAALSSPPPATEETRATRD